MAGAAAGGTPYDLPGIGASPRELGGSTRDGQPGKGTSTAGMGRKWAWVGQDSPGCGRWASCNVGQ